jgi:glutathione S-transferase
MNPSLVHLVDCLPWENIMMRVWGRTSSLNVQKVTWCLGELGQLEGRDYERIDAGLAFGVNNTPAYRQLNPNGLVPTLVDGDFVLWESHAIVRYLASRFATAQANDQLMPADLKARADSDRWMDWTQTTLWICLRLTFIGLTRTPEAQWDLPAVRKAYQDATQALLMLDHILSKQAYCAGPHFTMGDITLGVTVHRWVWLPERYPQQLGPRPELPSLMRWYRQISERPAFKTHIE